LSNATVAARIIQVIEAYEHNEANSVAVEQSIDLHEPALERISEETRYMLRRLSAQVIREDLSPLELQTLGLEPTRKALVQLKSIILAIEQDAT
jgi:hypothetical protein